MANTQQKSRGLLLSMLGWAGQTGFLLALLPTFAWSRGASIGIATGLILSTLVFGIGISELACANAQSGSFGILALANLVGLVLVAMLPDLSPANSRISFACPHCDLETDVAVDHAGQTGDCRRCGKPVQVPHLLSASDALEAGPRNSP